MASRLLDFVDPLIGSDSHFGFSTGNCLPLATMPFGMTSWSPQTAEGGWFFERRARKLQGIRATHQPSPWIGDYGHFVVMAQTGPRGFGPSRRAAAYQLEKSVVKPHHLSFDLIRYRTRMEMVPTKRCALFRFTFPETHEARIILEPCAGMSWMRAEPDNRRLVGYTRGNSGGCPDDFACYFVAQFDKAFEACGAFVGEDCSADQMELHAERVGAFAEFNTKDGEQVMMRIATSFVSLEQAETNLAREIGKEGFDEALERAERVWTEALAKILVDDDANRSVLTTFYTCLYRTHLFPRIWHEETPDNKTIHYSPYDGQIHEGVLYADNGFWDTYRTIYPLFALLMPDRLAEILDGWTNAYKEGRWFPQWASPGYRACMVGTHIDAVMADAVVRGVRDFDLETAFEGLLKHAYLPGDEDGNFGRIGIQDYISQGYVSSDLHHEAVARTLDYAFDDFCIAQIASVLGREDEAKKLRSRMFNYRHQWDAATGFMRGKNADGSWREPFNEYLWGDPYVEGGPWQASWGVQHDAAGLIELMGGAEKFCHKLDRMLAGPTWFDAGTYRFEIHEMTEMAVSDFGQYAQSNQPVHHVLYLYAAAGKPWKTQYWVRQAMDRLYSSDFFPGDEDNGEMSAWYVLNAMGLFPLCPGHPSFVLGSPKFRSMQIRPEDRPEIFIEAPANSNENVYVRRVSVNEQDHPALFIDHQTLANGAILEFEMSDKPHEAVVKDADLLPFSVSTVPNLSAT